jgi:hypothetical protein
MRSARRALEAVPPLAAVPALAVLQLLAVAALAHGQGWQRTHGDELLAAVLLAAQMVLLYAVAHVVAGRTAALGAGLLFVAAPVILAKRYFISGGGTPPVDYRIVYRHEVLPTAFGLSGRAGLAAACLVLLSAWLVLARTPAPAWAAAALSGAAAGGAALASPRAWPVLAAPALAALAARRPRAAAAALGTAAAGLVLLALFRHVPHVPLGWHRMGVTTDSIREFAWSRRVLEYLPLAGLVGLARRSAPAGVFFGVALLALVIFPLARPLDLTGYLLAIVPGLPVYWLLAASLPGLVPHARPRRAPAPVGSLGES